MAEYSISWDDDAPIPWGTYSMEGIELETACGIVANNGWFVRLAVCCWILNHNIVGLMILQQQQQQQKRITLIIRWYSTQEERHSTDSIELEMASKTDSLALSILVVCLASAGMYRIDSMPSGAKSVALKSNVPFSSS